MTEIEQIQEMAAILDHVCDLTPDKECESYVKGEYAVIGCDKCRATHLYAKGYRKVERGEWIETVHDWDFGDYIDYTCSICGIREQNKRKFCPECGADMRKEDEGK